MGSACSAYNHLNSSPENGTPRKEGNQVATIEKILNGGERQIKRQAFRSKLVGDNRNINYGSVAAFNRDKKPMLKRNIAPKAKVANVSDWTATVSNIELPPKVFTFREYKQYLQAKRQSNPFSTPVTIMENERCKTATLRKVSPKDRIGTMLSLSLKNEAKNKEAKGKC